jgi:hypothetical protein
MRRARRAGAAFAVALGLLAAATAKGAGDLGVVLDVGPVVRVKQDGAERPLRKNDPLTVGQTLRTGQGSQAIMRFDRDGMLGLEKGTRVTLAPPRDDTTVATIVVDQGTVFLFHQTDSFSPKTVEIETPAAAVSLRGTEVLVHVESSGFTVIFVNRGEAVVTSRATRGKVTLTANRQTFVNIGNDPTGPRLPESRRDLPFFDSPLLDPIKP